MQSRDGKSQREEKKRKEKESEEKKEDTGPETLGKPRNSMFFQGFVGSGRSKNSLPKAAGAEPSGRMRHENCMPLWRQANFQVKRYKTHQHRITFGSWDTEKIARGCGGKHISKSECIKMTGSDHLWEDRCRSRCGKKHISKSKC